MYRIRTIKQYRRDVKRLRRSGYDIRKLDAVVDMIASGQMLPAQFYNHKLQGEFIGFEECHIEPDWLLIYQIFENELILVLARTGTHAQLLDR